MRLALVVQCFADELQVIEGTSERLLRAHLERPPERRWRKQGVFRVDHGGFVHAGRVKVLQVIRDTYRQILLAMLDGYLIVRHQAMMQAPALPVL